MEAVKQTSFRFNILKEKKSFYIIIISLEIHLQSFSLWCISQDDKLIFDQYVSDSSYITVNHVNISFLHYRDLFAC